ncbi:MAG: hypothetical protein N3E47_05005, partial [Candidatus Bathyarchaeota archaeon]|nr:hypothetical protein [Candidatus Bathyarchaeota archaeon]
LSLRDTYDVAMHELAHAIVFKKRSSFFIKNNGQIYVDPNHTLANLDLLHLQANNGHGEEWRRIANALGADTSSFAIHKHHNLSLPELLGFRRSKH